MRQVQRHKTGEITHRQLGASRCQGDSWAAQALTIGVYGSALLHPVCMAATLVLLVVEPALPEDASLFVIALSGLNLMVLISGYAVTVIAGRRGLRRLGISGWIFPLATMPAYWMLMSAAAWLALWQFIVAPFHWNKTEHGLSSLQKRRSPGAGGPKPG